MKGKRLSILVLGATGMLGHTLFYDLLQDERFDVRGTIRGSLGKLDLFWDKFENRLIYGIDATHPEDIWSLILRLEPDVVINAIGMIRQRDQGDDPLTCVELNSRLPLLLDTYCRTAGVRLIHISTDCVFAGGEEIYTEESLPTASDVYGLSKYLGELHKPPSLTLRTSIIGHELKGRLSLLEWFLAKKGDIQGYTGAIYSGVPTTILANNIIDILVEQPELSGLYQISSNPISKYELLKLVAEVYGKDVRISPVEKGKPKILSYDRFSSITGYEPMPWDDMVRTMHEQHQHFLRDIGNGM